MNSKELSVLRMRLKSGEHDGAHIMSAWTAIDKLIECQEAMQTFVDRCDKGEVRSTKTYNKFKEILGS